MTEQKPSARGRWRQQDTAPTTPAGTAANPTGIKTYNFQADNGYTARLERDGPPRHPHIYLADIRDPAGMKVIGKELHLNLRDAKRAVTERIHQLEGQPRPAPEHNADKNP